MHTLANGHCHPSKRLHNRYAEHFDVWYDAFILFIKEHEKWEK